MSIEDYTYNSEHIPTQLNDSFEEGNFTPELNYYKDLLLTKGANLQGVAVEEILLAIEKFYANGLARICSRLCFLALQDKRFRGHTSNIKYTLANCSNKLSNRGVAAKFYREALCGNNESIGVPISFMVYGVSTILDNETDQRTSEEILALFKCLRLRIEEDGTCIPSRLRMAALCIELNLVNEAKIQYEEVLKLCPNLFHAMFNLSLLYLSTQEFYKLGMIYLKMANLLKEQINPYESYSEEDENNSINKSLKYYHEAQKIMPDNVEILLSLSELYRMIDKHKEALAFIEHALKVDDKDYRVYYEGFLAYEEIGDYHTAKEMIRICLMLNISFVKGFNDFGNLMRKEKMYDFAVELFETALMREPENVVVLNNYGTCFLEMGNKFRAKEIYLQSYHLNNNLYEVNCNLSIIYRKEYNYDKAIEHVLKAKESHPDNPQVYNILSSIYIAAGLSELALSSCHKSLELEPNNCTTLLQLAICLKNLRRFRESIQICINLLTNNPKYTEAFLNFMECLLITNSWNEFEENKNNVNAICEYQKHVNNLSSSFNFLIADYIVKDMSLKFWVYRTICIQELQNAKYVFDEIPNYESENKLRSFSSYKPLKIGYLIEDIKEVYTLNLIFELLAKHNINNHFYVVVFESERSENSFDWREILSDKLMERFIDLSEEENPKNKAEFLFKCQFDIIIFLENLSTSTYNNLTIKSIYQTLAIRPAKIQIILPSNGCTRDSIIFDYTITDNKIFKEKYRDLFMEKLIVMENSCLMCWNPFLIEGPEDLHEDPFISMKSGDFKVMANFSESYKIDKAIFLTWCNILNENVNYILVLKFCNEESSNNLKSLAAFNNVNPQRIIFIVFKNESKYKYASAEYLKFVDLYLDVQTVNGDLEILFCLFSNTPVVTINSPEYPITSALSSSVLYKLNNQLNDKIIFDNLSDYQEYIITFLNTDNPEEVFNNTSNNSTDDKACYFPNRQIPPIKKQEIIPSATHKFIKSMDNAISHIKKDYMCKQIGDVVL